MIDEGYIKFNCYWEKAPVFQDIDIAALNLWRTKLYDLDLVGAYANGIGLGNVSQRLDGNQFMISGTATGNLKELDASHYALVTNFDIDKNKVFCRGLTKASSESMSHAVIYQALPKVTAVFHVHHRKMWQYYLHKVPTTLESAAYGTPKMAYEILRLLKESSILETRFFTMAGHEEGIIAFGETLKDTGKTIIDRLTEWQNL